MLKSADRNAYWKRFYLSFLKSGLTQREYCRQNDINYWSFNQWKRRFDKSDQDISMQKISLKLPDNLNQNDPIEVVLNNNIRLSIHDTFSPDTLRKLIAILGEQK